MLVAALCSHAGRGQLSNMMYCRLATSRKGMHCTIRLGTQHNVTVASQAYLSSLLWQP